MKIFIPMKCPIDLYQNNNSTNDILYLSYLVSGNVESVTSTVDGWIVKPLKENPDSLTPEFASFQSFMGFLREQKVFEQHQNEIDFFKKRLFGLGYIILYDLYEAFRTKHPIKDANLNLETMSVSILTNELALGKDLSSAPSELAGFYKKQKNMKKYKKLCKEARNVKTFIP